MSKLINCRACGVEIAFDSAACPKCGSPNKKKGCGQIVVGFLILGVGVAILGAASSTGNKEKGTESPSRDGGSASTKTPILVDDPEPGRQGGPPTGTVLKCVGWKESDGKLSIKRGKLLLYSGSGKVPLGVKVFPVKISGERSLNQTLHFWKDEFDEWKCEVTDVNFAN